MVKSRIKAFVSLFFASAAGFLYHFSQYEVLFFGLLLLPLATLFLAWRHPEKFTIENRKTEIHRIDLTHFLILPGLFNFLWALSDARLLWPSQIIGPSLLVLAVLAVLITRIEPEYRWFGKLISIMAGMAAYAEGTIATGNKLFDYQPAQKYALSVLSKHETKGKGAHLSLTIRSFITGDEAIKVTVSRQLYQTARIGENVRLTIHPGLFGLRWYGIDQASACP